MANEGKAVHVKGYEPAWNAVAVGEASTALSDHLRYDAEPPTRDQLTTLADYFQKSSPRFLPTDRDPEEFSLKEIIKANQKFEKFASDQDDLRRKAVQDFEEYLDYANRIDAESTKGLDQLSDPELIEQARRIELGAQAANGGQPLIGGPKLKSAFEETQRPAVNQPRQSMERRGIDASEPYKPRDLLMLDQEVGGYVRVPRSAPAPAPQTNEEKPAVTTPKAARPASTQPDEAPAKPAKTTAVNPEAMPEERHPDANNKPVQNLLADNNSFATIGTGNRLAKIAGNLGVPDINDKQILAVQQGPGTDIPYAKSELVGKIQTLLNKAGANLDVDQQFGPRTNDAIMEFSKKRGLDVTTGGITRGLVTALEKEFGGNELTTDRIPNLQFATTTQQNNNLRI